MKEKLLELLKEGLQEEARFVAGMTAEERQAPSAPDNWSPKDVIAHNAAWQERLAQIIAAGKRGERLPEVNDVDLVNHEIYLAHCAQTWADVLAYSTLASAHLSEQVRSLSEAGLAEPLLGEGSQARWRNIVGNGYSHPLSHLAGLYVKRGNAAEAVRIQEEAARQLLALADEPRWRGVAIYNLACFYAQADCREKALANLRQALQLAPDLTGWSREDPDLLSLHGDPAYEQLTVDSGQ